MANQDNRLSDEWKESVYNFGGALVGLGKTVVRSVKVGVDAVYDRFNDEDKAKREQAKKTSEKSQEKKSRPVVDISVDDDWDE